MKPGPAETTSARRQAFQPVSSAVSIPQAESPAQRRAVDVESFGDLVRRPGKGYESPTSSAFDTS